MTKFLRNLILLLQCSLILIILLVPVYCNAACIGVGNVTTTANVVFGSYNPTNNTPTQTGGTVTATCSILGTGNAILSLSKGVNSASYTPRTMKNGTNTLNYNIYTSNTYATIWGDGTGGTSTVGAAYLSILGLGTATFNLFGQIPIGQVVTAGNYTDSITATVTF